MRALIETADKRTERVFLIGVELKSRSKWDVQDSLSELAELATTAGAIVVATAAPAPAAFVRQALVDHFLDGLDPKTRQAEYDWLEITADRETFRIVGLTAADAQGGKSSFTFSNFKENSGLADKMFQFTIPRGTEVISSGKTP